MKIHASHHLSNKGILKSKKICCFLIGVYIHFYFFQEFEKSTSQAGLGAWNIYTSTHIYRSKYGYTYTYIYVCMCMCIIHELIILFICYINTVYIIYLFVYLNE